MRPRNPEIARSAGSPGLLCGLLLVVAACTTPPGTPDAGGDFALYDVRCSTAAECVSGDVAFACDPIRRSCVCTTDAMCAAVGGKPWCNAFTGRCVEDVAGCKSDEECGAGRFCDSSLRTCRDKRAFCESCSVDDECGGEADKCVALPGALSTATYCATACGAGDACPDGQLCRDTAKGRQCLPGTGRCTAAAGDCNPDSGLPCARDADCAAGQDQLCDTVASRCVAARATCAADQVCDATTRACVGKCRLNEECAARFEGDSNWICVNNACVRALTCDVDGDCPSSTQWCFKEPTAPAGTDGICQTTCDGDEDCPLSQRCVNDDATARRRCVDGCRDNAGCPLNAICDDGRCLSTGPGGTLRCQAKEVCAFRQVCQNTSCVTATQHCKSCSGGCAGGACVDIPYAAGCGAATSSCNAICSRDVGISLGCPGQGCYCSARRCLVTCSTDAQCPNGLYCDSIPGFAGKLCQPLDPFLLGTACATAN